MLRLVLACLLVMAPALAFPEGVNYQPVQVMNSGAFRALTQNAVSCGTTSATVFTPPAYNGFVRVKVQEGSAQSVYFNWTGAAATTSTGELMAPGESIVFGPLSNSITCVTASGTATVIVTY